MATTQDAPPSEQEMTDTAEEDELIMVTSDNETQTLPHPADTDDSNSSRQMDDTESVVSTDKDVVSTPTVPPASPPATSPPPQPTSSPPQPTSSPPARRTSDPATPRKETGSHRKQLPYRQGIRWQKGEKVEAMDYLSKWYPAKIMDVDEGDCLVLIHFEGWNQRYDEWVAMTSEGIRPLVRHSGRKERGKKEVREYKAGEKVLAKWTDCKMYPAKVVSTNPNGSLEVVFYDGFQKTVQVCNVKSFPDRRQSKVSPGSPEVKKVRKKDEGTTGYTEKVRSTSLDEKDRGDDKKRKQKLIVAGSFLAKRDRSHSAPGLTTKVPKPRDDKPIIKRKRFGLKTSPVAHKKTSPGRIQKAIVSRMSSVKIKKELLAAKKTSGVEKRAKKRALSLPSEEGGPTSLTPASGALLHTPSSAPAVPAKRTKSTDKDKGLAPKEFVIEPDHNPFKCVMSGCAKSFRKESLLDYHLKYYHVDDTRTPQTHVPRPKRRKTSSICSTDSDISVCSKGKITPVDGSGSKRKRNFSAASDILIKAEPVQDIKKEAETEAEDEKVAVPSPVVVLVPMTPPLPMEVSSQVSVDMDLSVAEDHQGGHEMEDEVAGDEVVNCVCGFNEENGLMIQCDVCLCWQHASCFSIKFDALPSKYICFVCENPPGIRDSRRYIHDQDWHKLGQLRSFNFLHVKQPEDKCETIKATNSLIADVFNVKAVLHSLRQQNKVSCDENHPEMKTWRRICEGKRRKARINSAKSTATATEVKPKLEVLQAEDESSFHSPEVKEEPFTEEQRDDKHMVKFSLDKKSPEATSGGVDVKDTSLDLTDGSPERNYDKVHDTSMADNDSDTSTMTASESSTGYMSSFNPGVHGFEDDIHSADTKERSGPHDKDWKDERLTEDLPEDDGSDPLMFEDCERSLLLHIVRVQSELGDRLDLIEDQIAALEKADSDQPAPPPAVVAGQAAPVPSTSRPVLGDVPVLKKSLHSLVRDLNKVKTMASYH